MEIEERVELMNDLWKILNEGNRAALPMKHRSVCNQEVQQLSNLKIKGILLEYYINMKNINVCKEMNIRSKQYISKLKIGIYEEGYTIWERILNRDRVLLEQLED